MSVFSGRCTTIEWNHSSTEPLDTCDLSDEPEVRRDEPIDRLADLDVEAMVARRGSGSTHRALMPPTKRSRTPSFIFQ